MKTKSIPNLKFKDLGNDAFSVSTPTEHISLNSVILLVAKKQSGKTFFASNLMNQLKEVKACDRIFVISDTFNSNKKMMEHLDIKREDIFSPNDPNVIPEITKRIEADLFICVSSQIKLSSSQILFHSAATAHFVSRVK
jgi:hypothetical protein